MADADTFFEATYRRVSGEKKFFLEFYYVSTSFALALLTFAAFRSASIAAIAASFSFFILLALAYISVGDVLFTSPAKEDTLAASYTIPFLGYIVLGGGSALYSLATESYLSFLKSLPDAQVEIINLEYATSIETYFLPAISFVLFPYIWKALKSTDWLPDSRGLAVVLAAIPSSFGFAVLHGARTPAFLFFAAMVMFLWIIALGLEGVTESSLVPLLPISILSLIGLHRAHNFNAAGLTLYEFYSGLLSAGGAVTWVGVILIVRDALFFLFTALWLKRMVWDKDWKEAV